MALNNSKTLRSLLGIFGQVRPWEGDFKMKGSQIVSAEKDLWDRGASGLCNIVLADSTRVDAWQTCCGL